MQKKGKIYDVVVSGAGPSGSLLGYLLASSGLDTLIIEKERFPREKICAGGIQHRALSLLPFEIGSAIERTVSGIHFTYRAGSHFFKKYNDPVIYTVRRSVFDNLLAGYAKNAGCNIVFGQKVCGYRACDDCVEINAGSTKYRARILAGADGIRGYVHSRILNGAGINKIIGYEAEMQVGDSSVLTCGRLFSQMDLSESVLLDFGGVKKGYGWIFPKNSSMSAGIGAPAGYAKQAREYFYKFLRLFFNSGNYTEKESFLKHLKIKAHGIPVGSRNTPVCDYRVLTVGDAASIGDGFTGEGLFNCFRSSRIAAVCIENALKNSGFSFEDYHKAVNDEIFPDIEASLAFTKMFYNSPGFFYNLLKSDSPLFESCCRILRGERSYAEVLKKLKTKNIFNAFAKKVK